jgi:hypothetical protein
MVTAGAGTALKADAADTTVVTDVVDIGVAMVVIVMIVVVEKAVVKVVVNPVEAIAAAVKFVAAGDRAAAAVHTVVDTAAADTGKIIGQEEVSPDLNRGFFFWRFFGIMRYA